MLQLDQSACEFCIELGGRPGARFADIYPQLRSRVVAREGGLVVLPTLGQLFPGSLLLMPERHYETCADLPRPLADRMSELVRTIVCDLSAIRAAGVLRARRASRYRRELRDLSRASAPGAAPREALARRPLSGSSVGRPRPAHRAAGGEPSCDSQYLLAGTSTAWSRAPEARAAYARVADMATQPGSQYFRRLLRPNGHGAPLVVSVSYRTPRSVRASVTACVQTASLMSTLAAFASEAQ